MASENSELRWLHADLCGRLGICLGEEQLAAVLREHGRDPDTLVNAVLAAEGLDPLTVERSLRVQVRDRVALYLDRTRHLPA